MKHFAAATLVISLGAASVSAQEADGTDRGLSLMERGAQLFMEGIMKEMEPAISDLEGLADDIGPAMKDFARNMGPKLKEMFDKVDNWAAYQAPEMLPNGDIIIRRKPDHPMVPPEEPTEPEPQIEI